MQDYTGAPLVTLVYSVKGTIKWQSYLKVIKGERLAVFCQP